MKNYLPKDGSDDEGDGPQTQVADPAMAEKGKPGSFMDKFFEDIEKAKNSIAKLKGTTVQIKTLQDEALSAIGSEAEQAVSEKLGKVLVQANKEAALAKKVLDNLKKETEKMDRKKLQADIRVRENIHATCLQNLVVTVRANQQAQQEYKMKLQEKASRQIRVVKPDATDDEVKTVIQSGDVNAVYREALLQPGADPIAQVYLSVADKYQDVLKLEQSVIDLHKMFQELAVLVEAQGEMLDNIEYQVTMAKDYMASGNKQLNIALKARKQTRRRMCCFIVCLIIVIVIILGPVLGVLG